MSDTTLMREVRQARGKFASMVATYGLGVFNDSFFRQSAMLLAVPCWLTRTRPMARLSTARASSKSAWHMDTSFA